ncbi:putative mitochondrial protein, partial [Mucuna pruriens]
METNLVLNFEKCHFMVIEGIVLVPLISSRGNDVDKAKVDIIASLPNPASIWEVRSFLGHAGFYKRFIKNFNKIALPLSKLLQKDVDFVFNKPCLLAIVYALDKFCSHLLGSKIIVFSNHATLKFLLKKMDAMLRLIWWMLLLQEFGVEIRDKKGAQFEREVDALPIRDEFFDEQILQLKHVIPLYANIYNFLVASTYPQGASKADNERLESDAKYYIWDDPYLWRLCNDQIMRSSRSSIFVIQHPKAAIILPFFSFLCDFVAMLIDYSSRKTMNHLNLRGQRSFGIVLGVGSTISVG